MPQALCFPMLKIHIMADTLDRLLSLEKNPSHDGLNQFRGLYAESVRQLDDVDQADVPLSTLDPTNVVSV
jgi:hypothetical protein